jgi:hypothetical protein
MRLARADGGVVDVALDSESAKGRSRVRRVASSLKIRALGSAVAAASGQSMTKILDAPTRANRVNRILMNSAAISKPIAKIPIRDGAIRKRKEGEPDLEDGAGAVEGAVAKPMTRAAMKMNRSARFPNRSHWTVSPLSMMITKMTWRSMPFDEIDDLGLEIATAVRHVMRQVIADVNVLPKTTIGLLARAPEKSIAIATKKMATIEFHDVRVFPPGLKRSTYWSMRISKTTKSPRRPAEAVDAAGNADNATRVVPDRERLS